MNSKPESSLSRRKDMTSATWQRRHTEKRRCSEAVVGGNDMSRVWNKKGEDGLGVGGGEEHVSRGPDGDRELEGGVGEGG